MQSDLRELYQQVIIDHGRHPRNFGPMETATHVKEGYNPLCGDKLKLYLQTQNNMIINAQFEGSGCAISMATASLMTEALKGKTIAEVNAFFNLFHAMITGGSAVNAVDSLGKLVVLAGVAEYPMRVKCATLAWHTVMAAINEDQVEYATTE